MLALGVFLLFVKLVMFIAWHTAGIIALIGLVMFLVGGMLMRR